MTKHKNDKTVENGSNIQSDTKRSKSRVFIILGSILSVLIAIGAYSKDSLFVQYLIPVKTFSVVQTTSIGGAATAGIFQSYQTISGERLNPVQVMLYLNIRNESEMPQSIEGILLEFQSPNGSWLPITVLPYGNGYYTDFGGSTLLKKAKLLDLEGIFLNTNLGSASMAPHSVVSGWLFLKFPEQFRNDNMLNKRLRMTLCSGFGENELHEIINVDLPENAAQTRSACLKYNGIERDISELPIEDGITVK